MAKFNKGVMSQMQNNPSDTENDCYQWTAATNAEILIMADFQAYLLGSFD